jgi:uncharacterized tellurite resistance protein B-like protein
MFEIFKKKYKKVDSKENGIKKHGFEINLIGSVLAYEVARSDGAVSNEELNGLLSEIEKISRDVEKSSEEILELIKIYSVDSVSFYDFISDINTDFSKHEKLELIEYLWEVAYADNILDVHEERLIRRIADLINIKDMEVLKLKDKAKKS